MMVRLVKTGREVTPPTATLKLAVLLGHDRTYVLKRTVVPNISGNATPRTGTGSDARCCFVHRSPLMFIYSHRSWSERTYASHYSRDNGYGFRRKHPCPVVGSFFGLPAA